MVANIQGFPLKKLFKDCKTHFGITVTEKYPLLTEIKKKLTEDLNRYEEELAEKSKKDKYYWGKYRDKERIRHIKMLIEYFGKIGKTEKKPEKSFLEERGKSRSICS